MTEEQKTKWLVEHAMFFWQEAESPDANEMDVLFTALATRNVEDMKDLLRSNKMNIENEDQ